MEKFRKTIYVIVCLLTVLVTVVSLLSIFRNTESRYLKILDFPRIQWFIASAVFLLLFWVTTRRWRWYDRALLFGLMGGLVINGFYLVNYTPMVRPSVPTASAVEGETFSLLLANVKMKNRQAEPFLKQVRTQQPDLLLVMETDEWWGERLQLIQQDYPYTQQKMNGVAYGMVLYSRLPLSDVLVSDLSNEKVPSFEATVTLPGGKEFKLYTVHPVPPMHFSDYPDNKGEKENAMLKIGRKVRADSLPAVVAGDLNDVSWGFTENLFGQAGILHDVRVGRGFYNSFNAKYWWMRWPIDHVFVTQEFRVRQLTRLPDIHSDHYPIYVALSL